MYLSTNQSCEGRIPAQYAGPADTNSLSHSCTSPPTQARTSVSDIATYRHLAHIELEMTTRKRKMSLLSMYEGLPIYAVVMPSSVAGLGYQDLQKCR